jgi:hypothetical protein
MQGGSHTNNRILRSAVRCNCRLPRHGVLHRSWQSWRLLHLSEVTRSAVYSVHRVRHVHQKSTPRDWLSERATTVIVRTHFACRHVLPSACMLVQSLSLSLHFILSATDEIQSSCGTGGRARWAFVGIVRCEPASTRQRNASARLRSEVRASYATSQQEQYKVLIIKPTRRPSQWSSAL